MADRVIRPCIVDGCEKQTGMRGTARGWCSTHYRRWQAHGDVNWTPKTGRSRCTIEGCDEVLVGRGWCSKHWTRWKRYGNPTYRLPGEVRDGKRICPGCRVDKAISEYSAPTGRCKPCVAEKKRRHYPYTPVERVDASCDCCGAPFLADRRRWRYCSVECFEANRNKANWKHLVARRSRLREAHVETFDRVEIFERDCWVCRICGHPVDREANFPEPRSASLDHIVPVSRGGKHERANAQTACLYCNVRKGTSLEVEQWRTEPSASA